MPQLDLTDQEKQDHIHDVIIEKHKINNSQKQLDTVKTLAKEYRANEELIVFTSLDNENFL